MCHLRQVPYGGDVYPKEGCPSHPPLAIANELYRWVAEHKKSRSIDGDDMRVIDAEMAKLMDVCGACERIARTPMVVSYRIFARQCIVLFLFTLPWGISNDFKWWTIPITIVIAYFMLGMEIVAEHVENPFGYDEDDLDLEGICDTIARSVNNIFHQSGLEVTPP
jgi:putative membrane protein